MVQLAEDCTTSWKVVGLIANGSLEFFIDLNSSSHTVALGSTQSVTEKSTRNISWGVMVAGV
jgi:hypothetical protein